MEKLKLRNPHILDKGYRNFEGRARNNIPAGVRTFGIEFDEYEAEELTQMGWRLKPKYKAKPEDPDMFVLYVAVRFDKFPPSIITFTEDPVKGMVMRTLTEETVKILDYSIIDKSAVVISGSKMGKPYLEKLIVKIKTDEVDDFFADEYRMAYGEGEHVSTDEEVPFDI